MKINTKELEKLSIDDLLALSNELFTTSEPSKMDIIKASALTYEIAKRIATLAIEESEFDFKAWLVAQGWEQRLFHTFTKQSNIASFSLEFEDRDFGSDNVEAREIIQCWLRNNNRKIFDSCEVPATQQEAETLFKLFRL